MQHDHGEDCGCEHVLIPVAHAATFAISRLALVRRTSEEFAIYQAAQQAKGARKQAITDQLPQWTEYLDALKRSHVWGEFDSDERELLTRPLGGWSGEDINISFIFWEALATLLWAFGRLDSLPPWDQPFDDNLVRAAIERMTDDREDFLTNIAFREEQDIFNATEAADLWSARARLATLADAPNPELETLIADIRARAAEAGIIPSPSDDFSINGRPLSELSEVEQGTVAALATTRSDTLDRLWTHAHD